MKTVIYHSLDYDGIFCCEIAKYILGEKDVSYIGWNHGDPLVPIPSGGEIYILDLSPDCLDFGSLTQEQKSEVLILRVIWVDHHKTAIDKWHPMIPGYRIDGVAACRLAWQWFTQTGPLPEKQEYIDRTVGEPLSVRLAGEYDIWDKRDPNAEAFQFGLRSRDLDWVKVFESDIYVEELVRDGQLIQRYARQNDASICRNRTWLMEWEGQTFLCVNTARFNSLFFAERDVLETGHTALLGFCFDGAKWTVSLYHAKHNTGIDLSEIAKKYGGGGHRGACGFTCKELPFKLT